MKITLNDDTLMEILINKFRKVNCKFTVISRLELEIDKADTALAAQILDFNMAIYTEK